MQLETRIHLESMKMIDSTMVEVVSLINTCTAANKFRDQ